MKPKKQPKNMQNLKKTAPKHIVWMLSVQKKGCGDGVSGHMCWDYVPRSHFPFFALW